MKMFEIFFSPITNFLFVFLFRMNLPRLTFHWGNTPYQVYSAQIFFSLHFIASRLQRRKIKLSVMYIYIGIFKLLVLPSIFSFHKLQCCLRYRLFRGKTGLTLIFSWRKQELLKYFFSCHLFFQLWQIMSPLPKIYLFLWFLRF